MGSSAAGRVPDSSAVSQTELTEWWNNHVPGIEAKKQWIRSYDFNSPARLWMVEQVNDGESLLDVGCGPGVNYEQLLVKNIDYVGIDIGTEFVQACQEMFPEGDFRFGDAMELDFPDNSFDTVLLCHVIENTINYQDPIREALRVAKKRVIIIMWRPLTPGEDRYDVHNLRTGSNDYNARNFLEFIHEPVLPTTKEVFGGQRPNWGWVIYKTLDKCVFDLDDFYDHAPNMDFVFDLKQIYPKLKVTLFTIPAMTSVVSEEIAKLEWVELAVHGFTHEPNTECLKWDQARTHEVLDKAESTGLYVKGFKAPGWQIHQPVLEVLKERGYWVAIQDKEKKLCDELGLWYYAAAGNPLSVHGHMQNIYHDNPYMRNGIEQLIYERGLPWDQDTEFYFVSEKLV